MTAGTAKAKARRSPKAARPAPTPEPADDPAVLPEGEIRPVIIGSRDGQPAAATQMVTLFELDGVPHQIPRNPSAALVLRWMLDLDEHGQHGAALRMGITLLGKPALDKLAAAPEVRTEDLADIFSNIATVFFTSDTYRQIQAAPDPS